MAGPASRLGGQAAFFFAGNVFTLLVGLPLQIYVARVLGAEALGIFGLVEGGVAIVVGLVAFGLAPTLVKFIPVHLARGEYARIRRLVGSGLAVLLASHVLAYLLLLAALPYLVRWWPALAAHRDLLVLMGLMIPLTGVCFYLQQGLRGFQEIRFMVVGSSFLQLTIKAVLAVAALSLGWHLFGYVVAVISSVLFAAAWLGWGLWRRLTSLPAGEGTPRGEEREWIGFAAVMYTGTLVGLGTAHLDRFLLGTFAGSAAVGVLLVIRQLEQMPVIFLQMFLAVVAPMFSMAHAASDRARRGHLYQLTVDWVVRLSAPLFVFFFVFGDGVLSLYGSEFAARGAGALVVLLVGQAVNLCFGPLGAVLNMSGLERQFLRISTVNSILLLTATVVLLPWLGLLGAALAATLSNVFVNVAAYVLARRHLGLVWFDRRYLRWIGPMLVTIGVAFGCRLFGPAAPGALPLLAYLVSMYVAFHGVSLLRGLHEDDRELIRHLAGRIFAAKA